MAISIIFDKTAEEEIEKVVTPQKRLQDQVTVKSTDEEQIVLPDGDNVGIKKVIVKPVESQKLDDGVYTVEYGETTKVTETGLYGIESSGEYLVLNSLDTDILYSMVDTPDGKEYYSWSSGGIVRIANDTYFPEYLQLNSSGEYYVYNSDDHTLTATDPFEYYDEDTAYKFNGDGFDTLDYGLYEVGSSGSYEQVYLASSAAYIADGDSFTTMPSGTYTVNGDGEYSEVNYGGDGGALRVTSSGSSFEYVDTGVYNIINDNGYSYFESYTGLTDGIFEVSSGHAEQVHFRGDVAYTGISSGNYYDCLPEGTYAVSSSGEYSSVWYGPDGTMLEAVSSGTRTAEVIEGLYYIDSNHQGNRYNYDLPPSGSSDDAIIGFSSGQIYSHVVAPEVGESVTLKIGTTNYTITRND